MRYLGVDYGSKKVGLALSDEQGTMGFPYAVVANFTTTVDELCACIVKENVGAVVIGESRNLAGDENPSVKGARALGDSSCAHFSKTDLFRIRGVHERRGATCTAKAEKTRAPKTRGDCRRLRRCTHPYQLPLSHRLWVKFFTRSNQSAHV